MSDQYLKVTLSKTGELEILVPSATSQLHRKLFIPATAEGVVLLRKVLRERRKAFTEERRATLGTAASPTQEQVAAWLATNTVPEAERPAVAASKGINISNLLLDL